MPEPIPHVRARLDRTQINPHHSHTAFLVVEVTAPAVDDDTPRPEQPLNLGLAIDASGSMGEYTTTGIDVEDDGRGATRIAAAQRAAAGVTAQLDDADVLSVVSFADDTLTHIAAMPMSSGGRSSSVDAIGSIQIRGCTDLNGGWLKGAEHVARYMETHGPTRNRVLLLSDGYANRGVVEPDLLASTAAGLRNRGIYTSTVGIGLDYSTDQLEVLAEHGGGMMHHAEHAEDIVAVILAELNEMRTAVLDDVEVMLSQDTDGGADHGGAGATGIDAIGYPSTTEDSVITTPIGSLISGATRRIVYRIDIPVRQTSPQMRFTVSVAWRDEAGLARTSASQQVVLKTVEGRSAARDRDVALIAAQAWLDDTVRRSMSMNRREDYGELRVWAKRELADFRHYCERLPGGRELIHKMSRLFHRVMRPMQESSRKEISLSRLKSQRSSMDFRVAEAPAAWDTYLQDDE